MQKEQNEIAQKGGALEGISMEEYLAKRRMALRKSRQKEYPQELLLQMKAAEWFWVNARPAACHRLNP